MNYKKSQKKSQKNKNVFKLSKINRKNKYFIGGRPTPISLINCDNTKDLHSSVIEHIANATSCFENVEQRLTHFQGGWAFHPEIKPYLVEVWSNDINKLISIYNVISKNKMTLMSVNPDAIEGPGAFKQKLGILRYNLLTLIRLLNTFLGEINDLIKLEITGTESEVNLNDKFIALQNAYKAKFTCPNLPLPHMDIKKEFEYTKKN
jgi:hypothetical protein